MMAGRESFFGRYLSAAPALVIVRGLVAERTVLLAERAWRLGIPLVEVAVQSERDKDALIATVRAGRENNHPVGVGTVTSVELVRWAADAGAAFTVAPGFDSDVAEASAAVGLPHLPGVATATEIQHALSFGLVWQKAFPASVLGAGWLRAMAGPFRQVRFVATGGVDVGNGADFLAAGAALAFGSSFADAPDDDILRLIAGASVTPSHAQVFGFPYAQAD